MADTEDCQNCGATIGERDIAHLWNDRIVCAKCNRSRKIVRLLIGAAVMSLVFGGGIWWAAKIEFAKRTDADSQSSASINEKQNIPSIPVKPLDRDDDRAETALPDASTQVDVIAVVLGNKITVKDKDKLDGLILGALLEQFAIDNKIEPTEEELDDFVLKTDELERQEQIAMEARRIELIKELMDLPLSDAQREQKQSELETIENVQRTMREEDDPWDEVEVPMSPIKRQIAQQFVRAWKINKALYEQYGGRVIFQQAGVEPFDAYRQFLKEQERKGSFEILGKQYEESFWQYFTNDAMHTFYSEDDGARFINTPWWMTEEPPEE